MVEGAGARTLAGIKMFEGLDEAERRRIEERCQWRRYASGQTILEQGCDSRDVLFIVEGTVNIVNYSQTGREIAYAKQRAGDCFGELAAIDAQPRSASVVATEPTLVAILPAERFLDVLKEQVEVTFLMLTRLTNMVRNGDVRILELSTLAATQRVYAQLLRMARPDAAGAGLYVIHPLPPLREVASRVSTTRETVARAMSQLYPSGIIRRKGRSLYIMDRGKLEEMIATMQGERGN